MLRPWRPAVSNKGFFRKLARREAGDLAKSAAKCSSVRMKLSGDFGEPYALLLRLRKESCHPRDECCRSRDFIRPAAKARPKPLFLCFLACVKENYVLPQWTARRTRRPAIYMRGAHSQYKLAVGTGISFQRCLPVLRGSTRRDFHGRAGVRSFHRFHATKITPRSNKFYPERRGKVDSNETHHDP